jgi:hypothetical protein
MIPAFAYAVVMFIRYALSIPASVVEDLKARQAIRRSIDLAKGSWGRIFLLGLLVLVIQIGLATFTQGPFGLLALKQPGFVLPAWIQAIQQIIGFFTNACLGPIWAIGITLFYYDQRIRKEGFDIEWMMRAAGMTSPELVAAPQAAVNPVAAEPAAAEAWPALEPRPVPITDASTATDAPASPEQPPAPADPAPIVPPQPDAGSPHE